RRRPGGGLPAGAGAQRQGRAHPGQGPAGRRPGFRRSGGRRRPPAGRGGRPMTLRTALFYLLLGLSTVIWCLLSLLIAPWLPQKARYIFIARTWCRFAV